MKNFVNWCKRTPKSSNGRCWNEW